uniref:Uncharacterized protein n=1 Tax=Ascaris lumbricoides TaxID=6252 RepID=A0A0M3HLQ6_ASCLU
MHIGTILRIIQHACFRGEFILAKLIVDFRVTVLPRLCKKNGSREKRSRSSGLADVRVSFFKW